MIRLLHASSLMALLALPVPATAGLATSTGPVVLAVTVDGAPSGDAAEFDLDMLESLPQHTTETETPWHVGMTEFTGPLLSTVVDAAGAEGDVLRVYAINSYSAQIPVSDIVEYPVILATRINGERFSVRDKGPLFVIYPFSDAPELYNEVTFNKSIWQVAKIDIE